MTDSRQREKVLNVQLKKKEEFNLKLKKNIKLNDELKIIEKNDFNEIIKVKHHNEHITMSMKTAKMLFGTK